MLFLIQPIEDRGACILHRALAAQIALLVPWFLAGTVLTTSYKSLLLSTLIPIQYGRAIENVADAADSAMHLVASVDRDFMEDEFHFGAGAIFVFGLSWLAPKHSPLLHGDFSRGLQRVIDTGILKKLYVDAGRGRRPPRKPRPRVRIDEPLTLLQLQTAGFILVAGLAISTLQFAREKVVGFSTTRRDLAS